MSTIAGELIEILDGLPDEKAREVVDFARFLQQQAGDREWERSTPTSDRIPSWTSSLATRYEKVRRNRLSPASCDLQDPPRLLARL